MALPSPVGVYDIFGGSLLGVLFIRGSYYLGVPYFRNPPSRQAGDPCSSTKDDVYRLPEETP